MGVECGAEGTAMWKDGGTKKARPAVAHLQQSGNAAGHETLRKGLNFLYMR